MRTSALAVLLGACGARADTILYDAGQSFDGLRSSRSSANGLCAFAFTTYGCSSPPIAFILFNGETLDGFAINKSAPVLGPTGQPIAPNFTALYTPPTIIYQSLAAAFVIPPGSSWWSGSTAAGTPTINCDDWTSNSNICIIGKVGSANGVGQNLLSSGTGTCTDTLRVVCICNGGTALTTGAPTTSPTASPTVSRPTASPTARPTKPPTYMPSGSPTRSPSGSPTTFAGAIVLYTSTAGTSLDWQSTMSLPQAAEAYCAPTDHYSGHPAGCNTFTMVISYSGYDAITQVPIALGVLPSVAVHGPTAILLATNWTNVFSSPVTNLFSAGVISDAFGDYFAGTTAAGLASGTDCSGWTTVSSSFSGSQVNTVSVPIFSASGFPCNSAPPSNPHYFVCACTERPTHQPTRSPSSSPSSSAPSGAPTSSAPSKSPSLRPSKAPTTTASPTTASPTTAAPTTLSPTTASPTTASPTTVSPTTAAPTTGAPTFQPSASPSYHQTVIFYSNEVAHSAALHTADNAGNICKGMAQYSSLHCDNAFAYICFNTTYTMSNAPTLFGFNPLAAINGPTGTAIATGWSNLQNIDLIDGLSAAGVLTTTNAFTGCSIGGGSSADTCIHFSSTSNAENVLITNRNTAASISWQSGSVQTCDLTFSIMCACLK